jgi:hypothetical protein
MARAVQLRGGAIRFRWETLIPAVRTNLGKNGFLAAFGQETAPIGNTIPYREHGVPNKDEIMSYLRKQWLGRGWVSLSEQLRDAVLGSIWEIYANAGEHSESPIGVIS